MKTPQWSHRVTVYDANSVSLQTLSLYLLQAGMLAKTFLALLTAHLAHPLTRHVSSNGHRPNTWGIRRMQHELAIGQQGRRICNMEFCFFEALDIDPFLQRLQEVDRHVASPPCAGRYPSMATQPNGGEVISHNIEILRADGSMVGFKVLDLSSDQCHSFLGLRTTGFTEGLAELDLGTFVVCDRDCKGERGPGGEVFDYGSMRRCCEDSIRLCNGVSGVKH